MNALPRPIHVDATPKFHPNCPAYPTKMTAEKYDVHVRGPAAAVEPHADHHGKKYHEKQYFHDHIAVLLRRR